MSLKLASQTILDEDEPRITSVDGVQTAEVCMLAICASGPVGVSTLTTSMEEWVSLFGGPIANGNGYHAALGFYDNGGKFLNTTRVVHYTDILNAATKTSAKATVTLKTAVLVASAGVVRGSITGPFALTPGDTFVGQVDGNGSQTATVTATAAARESAAGTFNMAGGKTLTLSIDGGSVITVTFIDGNFAVPGAATALEVVNVINARFLATSTGAIATVTNSTHVSITSLRRGTGSGVNITGGSGNAAILAFTTGNLAGTGNVSNVSAVTVTEIKTMIEAAWTNGSGVTVTSVAGAVQIASNTTGASSSILVVASSTADDETGLDNATHTGTASGAVNTLQVDAESDGTYANTIQPVIATATSGNASQFNLSLVQAGLTLETWPNLTMDDTLPNYAPLVVNNASRGSKYVVLTDLAAATTPTNAKPVNGTFILVGGGDGLSSIGDNDFVGSQSASLGLRSFDIVEGMSLLIVPDRATAAVQLEMMSYCETTRSRQAVAVLDPPASLSATAMIAYVQNNGLQQFSEFGITYWPRIAVANPSPAVFGASVDTIVVPPSGHIVGCYARNDATQGGIYKATAGLKRGVIKGALGVENDEARDINKRNLVYPELINPITTKRGRPRYIDGTRMLKSTGNFPTIAERRGVIFIEQSISNAIDPLRHDNVDERLRAEAERAATGFLKTQMDLGAFRSQKAATAFFVDFGASLNTAATQFAGELIGRIGLATQKPADYIILNFAQDTRALDAELAG